MTDYVLPPAPPVSLPVAGRAARFAVRRIFCVGRNYAEHAREMGHDPERELPFFFGKPADFLLTDGADLPYPPMTADLHFEAELVVALGRGGQDIPAGEVRGIVWGYAAGIDFTRRDLQARAKAAGRPWDLAKGFSGAAVAGPLHAAAEVGHPDRGAIRLEVDGIVRQAADLSDMIWSVPEIIADLSRYGPLAPGDLIYTGTPAGVGAVGAGAVVRVTIADLDPLVTRIVG